MFKLPVKLLEQIESMTPEQQEEVTHHLSIKLEAEKRRSNQCSYGGYGNRGISQMGFNQLKEKITNSIPLILGISVVSAVAVGILYDNSITAGRYLDEHFYLFFIPLIPILLGGIVLVLDFARMGLQVVFEEYHTARNEGVPPEKALFRVVVITLLIIGFFYLAALFGG
jgi:hypothetical protein